MTRYAQTNLQLYAQLTAAGWDESELELIARGYELVMEVCGATVRPNGKPFLCHLVGTASILVSWHAPTEEVICGLVHSVYTHGVFADREPGMTTRKRAVVRGAVGDQCEALVADYTRLTWSAAEVERMAVAGDSPTAGERSAVRVRLANELEDHLDLGMQFSQKTKVANSPRDDDPVLVLAERFVSREFKEELAAEIAANAVGAAPPALVRTEHSSFRPAAPQPSFRARLTSLWSPE